MEKKMRVRHSSVKNIAGAAVALGLFSTAAFVHADTVHIPASQDATLWGGADSGDSSSGPGMFVGSDGTSPKRGLIEFNIASAIPAGATITSATLSLVMDMVAGSGGKPGVGDQTSRTIRLFDVTTPWHGSTNGTTGRPGPGFGGTGHGFAANAGDSTWIYSSFNTVQWNTQGGDFLPTESADTLVSENLNTAYTWTSLQMSTDVQGWLDGTVANDGWLLKNDDELGTSQTFRAFYTAEGAVEQGVPNFAPSLIVTYSVPEPASLGMLIFGSSSLLLTRRRQR
jgi:hypothetical protein